MAILADTCIIIDYLRGKLELKNDIVINPIIELELLVGARNKAEQREIAKLLDTIDIVELNGSSLELARVLIIKHSLSHNLKIPDALIATTSIIYDLPLWTHNKKDFRYIDGLALYE